MFPATNVTLLTIADKKGSEQINGWITPLKQRFGKRVDIRGLADVSTVPRLLRGMLRTKFQKSQTYPVMMDWSGEVVKAFTYVPDKANVLVLDGRGHILKRVSGEANPRRFRICAPRLIAHWPTVPTHFPRIENCAQPFRKNPPWLVLPIQSGTHQVSHHDRNRARAAPPT